MFSETSIQQFKADKKTEEWQIDETNFECI